MKQNGQGTWSLIETKISLYSLVWGVEDTVCSSYLSQNYFRTFDFLKSNNALPFICKNIRLFL